MCIFLWASIILLAGICRVGGQSTGQVYHAVGPAMFTNAAAWAYPDGLLAGSNFVCGVYAGTVSNALAPSYDTGHLEVPFSDTGAAWLWGGVVVDGAPGTPVLLQFRAWPAEFGSYEAAVAWSNPSPPVGMSEIFPALGVNVFLEFPIATGLMWLSPVLAPGGTRGPLACRLAANSLILSWPTNSGKWVIVGASSLTMNSLWSPVEGQLVITNGYNQLAVSLTNEAQFFRLAH